MKSHHGLFVMCKNVESLNAFLVRLNFHFSFSSSTLSVDYMAAALGSASLLKNLSSDTPDESVVRHG